MALNSIALLDLIPAGEREEEALFARDEDDALIRRDKKTQADFIEKVKLTIDGISVTVPRATPVTDAQGNTRYGPDGKPIPRATTIYDAATELVKHGIWTTDELTRRIPVLCHQEHVTPVAVCRMCCVHVSKRRKRDGKLAPGEKLVPACQHEVQADMVVTTRACDPDGADRARFEPNLADAKGDEEKERQLIEAKHREREETARYANQVNRATRILTELLLADHYHPDPSRDKLFENELTKVAAAVAVSEPRAVISRAKGRNNYVHPKSRPIPLVQVRTENIKDPYSARTISVDHDRCILCDRCVRACSEVKPFKIIGHTGKGYYTRISFDLDLPMDQSNCVQCGECMTSCPTGALTLKRRVAPKAFPDAPPIPEDPTVPLPAGSGLLSAEEMRNLELVYCDAAGTERTFYPFRTISFAYLKWNEGAVRRRSVKPGDILCRQGEYGTTAFLIQSGRYDIYVHSGEKSRGLLGSLLGSSRGLGGMGIKVGEEDQSTLILGELAVLSNKPRTATIIAATNGVVYEVTRNLLDMAQRSPSAREVLAAVYRRNAVRSCLRAGSLFSSLNDAQREVVSGFLMF
jgi:ferredoxin